MRYIIEAALHQAELLNRTLVLPSFVYARACEYDMYATLSLHCINDLIPLRFRSSICADYVPMVNKNDAIGWDEWRELPIEQQMAFRIPISVMVNITHLRSRHPVVTASEYLRLHGQDPETESSSGFWLRQSYHSHPNVFETNKTKTPSLFVIENHWYDPAGINRVDYIPEAMKIRGNLEHHSGPDGSAEYWPPLEPTELSSQLAAALPENRFVMEWSAAKNVLNSSDLVDKVHLNDDKFVEEVLNAQGWEVLHTFQGVYVHPSFSLCPWLQVDPPSRLGFDFAKAVVSHLKQIVPRSSIRGFRDDFYDVDADVVVLAGETHLYRKPVSSGRSVLRSIPIDSSGVHAFHGGVAAQSIRKHGRAHTHPTTEGIRPCRGSGLSYASNDGRSSVDGSTYATRRLYASFFPREECKP
jgi:hypothetical protein